jgi:glycosyltransferase involved in cell wall biosynthesis
MRLVYDFQIFSFQRHGGISRYFVELANRAAGFSGLDVSIVAPLHINDALRGSSSVRVIGKYIRHIPKTAPIRLRLNTGMTRWLLHRNPPDVVHETYYSVPKLAPAGTRTVTTIYDMIPEKFPDLVPDGHEASVAKAQAVERADHVICISDTTRSDLLEILKVDPKKVSVVHLASTFSESAAYPNERPRVLSPYLLFVGRRSQYKNFDRLLRAYAQSRHLRDNFKLVCFGGEASFDEENSEMRRLGVHRENVVRLTGDDRSLAAAYAGASLLVYPSLYEGFGIPVVEAMSLRCPVACSNTGSMPEIVGDAGEYFDPYSVESIAHAMEKIAGSPARAKELVDLGLKRVKRFSWQSCADQTRLAYASLS